MYYDRETQRKYIRRFILSVAVIIASIVLAVVITNNVNSGSKAQELQTSDYSDQQFHSNNNPNNNLDNSNKEESEDKDETLYRVISVTDGDTIRINYNGTSTPLRIIGIDTPETVDSRTDVECFGPEATKYLTSLLTGKSVKIEADPTQDDLDKYERLLRYVYLDNEDVGLKMIEGGYASEYTYNLPYKNQAKYKAAEASAKQNKKGQWADGICGNTSATSSVVEQPKAQTQQVATTNTTTTKCLIKGNINNKGEKIYHMPGQKYYNDTIITESKGERWFCTEQEAISAGWRKAKV